jgi:phospholipid/cholesterol/gamma-HCH transport system substrate-binding protein
MREGTRNFLVGLVSIIALVGLAALLLLFGELKPLFRPEYRITVNLNEAGGLREGGVVDLNGVAIGTIRAVAIQQNPQYPVRVEAAVSKAIEVPATVTPDVVAALIGGSSLLSLKYEPPGPGEPTPPPLPTDGSAQLYGIQRGMLEEITAALDERMKPIVEGLSSFEELSRTYTELGRNLNDLVKPASLGPDGQPLDVNIRTAVERLNNVLAEIEGAATLAREWLGDEQIRTDARTAVANASVLIEKATTAVEQYTQLAQSLESSSGELVKGLLPVADQLSVTLEEVRRVTKAAGEGEGTVGQLLNNPDLYNSMADAAVRLERVLRELELFLQKAQAEGLPIRF